MNGEEMRRNAGWSAEGWGGVIATMSEKSESERDGSNLHYVGCIEEKWKRKGLLNPVHRKRTKTYNNEIIL